MDLAPRALRPPPAGPRGGWLTGNRRCRAAATLSVSLTTLTLSIGLLLAGPLSERIGRTHRVHLCLVAASVLGLVCATSPSWELLLVAFVPVFNAVGSGLQAPPNG